MPFPHLLQRDAERPFFHLGIALRERCLDHLFREPPGGKLAFDPARAVFRTADADGRSRGAQLVEPS
ncbi:MAG TPA: hypothetical protein VLE54_00930, partial [Thermoanaerobaculia bacterium]|nr:hypothetical protein [Thermoanaerobaculia bacterium]